MEKMKEIVRIKRWYRSNEFLLQDRFPNSCMCSDPEKCYWIMIRSFPLPDGFERKYSRLLLLLPGIDHPITTKPMAFCLDAGIKELLNTGAGNPCELNTEPESQVRFCKMKRYELVLDYWEPQYGVKQGDNLGTVVDSIYKQLKVAYQSGFHKSSTEKPKNI